MKTRELDFVFRLGIVAVFFVNGIFKLQNIDGVTLWMESYGFPGLFIIPAISRSDPDYYNLLIKAVKKKLNVLCYDCKFSTKGIKLNQEIELKLK